jgi:mannonate dehydratase
MKVSADVAPVDADLKAVARYGIQHIVSHPIIEGGRLYATVDELSRMREAAERNGLSVDVLTPPNLASSHIDREAHPGIMLAQSPERDREIESFQTMIRNCATAGIPCIKYNMSILGVLRTGRTPGRGDSSLSAFTLAGATPNPPVTRAGRVTPDMYWERITYFLEHVVPTA